MKPGRCRAKNVHDMNILLAIFTPLHYGSYYER